MVTEAISPEFLSKLEARGVSRRSFMKLCGSLAACIPQSGSRALLALVVRSRSHR